MGKHKEKISSESFWDGFSSIFDFPGDIYTDEQATKMEGCAKKKYGHKNAFKRLSKSWRRIEKQTKNSVRKLCKPKL